MNLSLVRQIRLMAVIAVIVGAFGKVEILFQLGFLVWALTFVHSLSRIEEHLFGKKDEDEDENENKSNDEE